MQRLRLIPLLSLSILLTACSDDAKPNEGAAKDSSTSESNAAPTTASTDVETQAPAPVSGADAPATSEETAKTEGATETSGATEAATAADETAKAATPDASADSPAGDGAAKKREKTKKAGDKAGEEKPAEPAKPKFAELAVHVTKAGEGTAATAGRRVWIDYSASLVDAAKPFDSTRATRAPLEVDLSVGARLPVIEGLRQGLEGLKPGCTARLEIPAKLAWGEKGNPAVGVPANADVVFEVTVIDVQ